jgi:hypothetical protein
MTGGGVLATMSPILAMTVLLHGCADPRGQSNAQLWDYEEVGQERTIDPVTGDVIITSFWRYEDGVTTTTKKRIPKGNEERQYDRPPAPPPRAFD